MSRRFYLTAAIGACLAAAIALPVQAQRFGRTARREPYPPGAGAFDNPAYAQRIGPVYYAGPHRGYHHPAGPYYWEGYNRPAHGTVNEGYRDPWRHQYHRPRFGPIPPWHR